MKIIWPKVWAAWRMCTFHHIALKLVLHYVDMGGVGPFMLEDNVISEFTWEFVLDLSMQILKHVTVMVCTDCVIQIEVQ